MLSSLIKSLGFIVVRMLIDTLVEVFIKKTDGVVPFKHKINRIKAIGRAMMLAIFMMSVYHTVDLVVTLRLTLDKKKEIVDKQNVIINAYKNKYGTNILNKNNRNQ